MHLHEVCVMQLGIIGTGDKTRRYCFLRSEALENEISRIFTMTRFSGNVKINRCGCRKASPLQFDLAIAANRLRSQLDDVSEMFKWFIINQATWAPIGSINS